MGNFYGCSCTPGGIWFPYPSWIPKPTPTATAAPPPSAPTQGPPPRPTVCPSNWVALGLSQQCGLTTGCGGNFGALFYNGCQNYHLGADHSVCRGQWVKGWNVECDSSGYPTLVTTPNGNFGYCFDLSRNCGDTLGVASLYNYQYQCCSPL